MFLQKRTRWKWAYPNHYKRAFAYSIIPYLYNIVKSSQTTYLLQQELYRLNTLRSNNQTG